MNNEQSDQQFNDYLEAKRNQVMVMREGGSAYQLQTAAQIEARVARLESGEETLPADFFDEPKPVRKRATKPKTARPKGNSSKVDIDAGLKAIRQAGGNKQLGWSKYVILMGLRPGCDAKDFYAFYEEG